MPTVDSVIFAHLQDTLSKKSLYTLSILHKYLQSYKIV